MAKRRKWIDDLKQELSNDQKNSKKIKVLSEKIYLHGKLCKETNFEEKENHNTNKFEDSLILPSTPLKQRYFDSLTPTFRNPDSYVIETNKVLKKMTPKKLSYASNQIEENIISTSEIIRDEFSGTIFNELTNLESLNCQNINDINPSLSISISVDHLSENSSQHHPNCPGPRTRDEPVTYRAASTLQSPSHRPGTSEEPVTYRAASVPRSPPPRSGTSDEFVTYRADSVLQSPPLRSRTSDELVTYRAASVPRSPPPRSGTSDEFVAYRADSVLQSPPLRSGTSDEPVTYRAASVPRSPSHGPGTSDEFVTYRVDSVLQSPSHGPGTSVEPVTYRAASVPRSPPPRSGTSDEFVTYRADSVLQSPPLRSGTSDEPVTYRAVCVPRSPSPRPGTSDEPVTYGAACIPRPGTIDEPVTYRATCVPPSLSPRPGTSDEPVTYQAACVPRPGTSNEQLCIVHYSPEDSSLSKNVAIKKHQPKRKFKKDSGTKPAFDESYIDFIIDKEDRDTLILNEAFPSEESDSWNDLTSDESDEQPTKKKKIKPRKNEISAIKKKSKSEMKKENKNDKNLGKRHKNSKGTIVENKVMKKNPCANNKCSNRCGEITEERRHSLFDHFWKLQSKQRRRDWIAQITEKTCVNFSRINNSPESSRRKFTYTHYINEGEGRRKVCQKFLIDTLDITQKFILYTVTHKINGFAKLDERGKNVSHNKTPPEILEDVKSFILSLPLLPSHYSRKDSKKLYLQGDVKNITNLYNIYLDHVKKNDVIKPVSFKVFSAYFKNNFNIGFHIPKKDKCVLCSKRTYDVLTEEETYKMNAHIKEKEDSYKRFIFQQNLSKKDKSVICASFDLQKVLNTPHGKNMSLYYSRKLSVYNFTIYESGTQEGFCHIWNETDAHRGANEIATILLNYIKEVDSRGYVNTLLLYADSCYGQNKNKTMLSMLRYALAKTRNIKVIQINYLVPGHTYMPVDSMHTVIERSIKDTTIWAPSHWPTAIALARKNPFPYKVTLMEGKDFIGFEDIINNTFKKTQKLMISTISVATFKKNELNKMFVKRSMSTEAENTEVILSAFHIGLSPKEKLYPYKLPISAQKYADLKKLTKQVIPAAYANEYLNLKYCNKNVDRLPESDEDDSV